MNFFFKKILFSLLCFIFILNFSLSYADDIEEGYLEDTTLETSTQKTSELNINARSCIVLDRPSKKILYGKKENNKVKMASTTKIITT